MSGVWYFHYVGLCVSVNMIKGYFVLFSMPSTKYNIIESMDCVIVCLKWISVLCSWWLTGTGLITGPMWMVHRSFELLYILFSKINKQYYTVQEHQMLLHSPSDLEMNRKKNDEKKERSRKRKAEHGSSYDRNITCSLNDLIPSLSTL